MSPDEENEFQEPKAVAGHPNPFFPRLDGAPVGTNWSELVRLYRVRHGMSQQSMAQIMSVSQRTISRWERGEDMPSLVQQRRLRDLGWEPANAFLRSIAASVLHCPASRALTRGENLRLEALSPAALAKRPSMSAWLGQNLAPLACGILEEMLDDAELQRSIAKGEIASLLTVTRSVFQTPEHAAIGTYRTTVCFFFHEGTIYSDSIGTPVDHDTPLGYWPVPMDQVHLLP